MIVLIFMATFAGIFGALQEDYDSSTLSSYESSESSTDTAEEPAVEAAEPASPSVDYEEEEEQ